MQADSDVDEFGSHSDVQATFKTPVAKRRKSSLSSSASSSTTTTNVESTLSLATDTLRKLSSSAPQKDELDHFGSMVACQLRSLPEEQRSMAMLRFSAIIHEMKYSSSTNTTNTYLHQPNFSSRPNPPVTNNSSSMPYSPMDGTQFNNSDFNLTYHQLLNQ